MRDIVAVVGLLFEIQATFLRNLGVVDIIFKVRGLAEVRWLVIVTLVLSKGIGKWSRVLSPLIKAQPRIGELCLKNQEHIELRHICPKQAWC